MKRERVKRAYDASNRLETAERTREEILEAAHRLFVARGYQGTTMSEIAGEAKVAVDTVYASVGKKQSLLRLLVEAAISGTPNAVPAEQRDYVKVIRGEADARRKIELYAHALRPILERLAPLLRVLQGAAACDYELADLWREIATRRARNMRAFTADLVATGQLRADVDLDEAADVIWATNAPEFFLLLTRDRGWSSDKFEAWLSRTWIRLLLGD